MHNLSRRDFTKQGLGSLLTLTLLETICDQDLLADPIKPITNKWLGDVNELSQDLKGRKLSQLEWQTKTEELFSQVDLTELLRFIDFKKLTKNLKFVDNGARSLRFKFPEVDGLPKDMVFGKQIFALKKDRSVVPHGHNNMATAFLILQGDLHGRHYDRLEESEKHMIIKPTIDRTFRAAEYSTVSDFRDNIHWFKATSEPSYIFNIHVLNLNTDFKRPTGRVYVNPMGKELSGGRIRAPLMDYRECHKVFG